MELAIKSLAMIYVLDRYAHVCWHASVIPIHTFTNSLDKGANTSLVSKPLDLPLHM